VGGEIVISWSQPSLWWFFNEVRRLWLMSFRRRSQKADLSWEKFIRLVARFFPPIRHYTYCHVTVSTPKPEGGDPVR
jgi:RNA-directed DNA polymerase